MPALPTLFSAGKASMPMAIGATPRSSPTSTSSARLSPLSVGLGSATSIVWSKIAPVEVRSAM